MHIPDGFLDLKTLTGTYLASGAAGAYAIQKIKKVIGEEKVPLLGVTAAFIFAAQMVNFPIISGTSGHLIGGMLAALLLGPWAGFLVIVSVLIVQAFVFADGGLTALGANILNMGVIGTIGAYWSYRAISSFIPNQSASVFLASWGSVFFASIAAGIEISISGYAKLVPALVAMGGIHALIGVGEGIITTGIIQAISSVRPDLIAEAERTVS